MVKNKHFTGIALFTRWSWTFVFYSNLYLSYHYLKHTEGVLPDCAIMSADNSGSRIHMSRLDGIVP